MAFKDHPLRGFLVPDTRLVSANEVTADAAGDEASPRAPGIAEPSSSTARMALEVTGDQDTDLVFQVEQGGHPMLGTGARISWRTSAEASTARRGWNAPNLITGWTAADYSTTANTQVCALAMQNGQILVAYRNGSTTAYLQTYTPDTDTWSGTIAFPSTVHATGAIALAQLPEGNVVVMFRESSAGQWRIYRYSVADAVSGGSWVLHATDMLDTVPGTLATWARLIITPAGEWAFFYAYSNALWQYASSSAGQKFTRVVAGTPTASTGGDAVLSPTGKIIVFADASSNLTAYTIGSAWTPYSSVTGVTAITGAAEQVYAVADHNRRIYVYSKAASTDAMIPSHTDDDGATWASYGVYVMQNSDTNTYISSGQAVWSGGSCWVCHQFVGDGTTNDPSVMLLKLGGFSSITTGIALNGALVDDHYRLAPGIDSGTFGRGRYMLPWSPPANTNGFTATGAGSIGMSSAGITVTTVANTYYWDSTTTPASGDYVVAQFSAKCSTGGSATAHNAGLKIRLTSTSDYEVGIYLTTTSFVVYDVVAGSALATVTVDMTAAMEFFVAFIPNSHLFVAYKRPYVSTWTEAYEGGATTGTASTGRYVRWGTSNASTTVHSYKYLWHNSIPAAYAARLFDAASNSTYNNIIGRMITRYPASIDKRSAYGRRQTWVAGKDGPGRVTDTFTAAVRADYPREAIHWQHAPSPRTVYRNTSSASAVAYAWQPAVGVNTAYDSTMIAMCVLNTNAKTHVLSGDPDDGGGYDVLGTMDLSTGFSGLTYTRTGNVIRINGGSSGSRFVWDHEFVGASIDLGSSKVRRIGRHTSGTWTSTGAQVVIVLATEGDGAYDGSEPASGTCSIIAHSGVLIIPNINASHYKKLKWSVAAQDAAGGYLQTGQVLIGGVRVVGQQWDWGWSIDHNVPTSDSEARPGVLRRMALGPVGRELQVAWSEGVDISRLRDTSPPDYLSDNSGDTTGLVAWQDAPYRMAGLLAETKGGEVPVVVLPKIPTSATTITDPTLFLYGRIMSGVRLEHVVGDEGTSEVYRLAQVTVREIV